MTDDQFDELCRVRPGGWLRDGSSATAEINGVKFTAWVYRGPFGGRPAECLMSVDGLRDAVSSSGFSTSDRLLRERVARIAAAVRA